MKSEWVGTRRWREKRVRNLEPEGKRQTTKKNFERGRTEEERNRDEKEKS